jgi:hypothetical protein
MTLMNQAIWLAPEKNRSMYVANYTLVTAVLGTAIGSISGGAFMEYTKPVLASLDIGFLAGQRLNAFHCLFIGSSLLRLSAVLIFLPRVKEENSSGVGNIFKGISTAVGQRVGGFLHR